MQSLVQVVILIITKACPLKSTEGMGADRKRTGAEEGEGEGEYER